MLYISRLHSHSVAYQVGDRGRHHSGTQTGTAQWICSCFLLGLSGSTALQNNASSTPDLSRAAWPCPHLPSRALLTPSADPRPSSTHPTLRTLQPSSLPAGRHLGLPAFSQSSPSRLFFLRHPLASRWQSRAMIGLRGCPSPATYRRPAHRAHLREAAGEMAAVPGEALLLCTVPRRQPSSVPRCSHTAPTSLGLWQSPALRVVLALGSVSHSSHICGGAPMAVCRTPP